MHEGKDSGRGTNHRRGRSAPDAEKGHGDAALAGPTDLFRRAVAACPFIDDDWPEYARALPRLEAGQVRVAWLLRWNRSREQIAEITAMSVSTVNYHAMQLRARLDVSDCRDVGAKTGHLVNLLRRQEGRLIPEGCPGSAGNGEARQTAHVAFDAGRRPPRRARRRPDGSGLSISGNSG